MLDEMTAITDRPAMERPIDHEWSNFEGHVLTADGRTNQARTAYTANVLAPEDIALCESVQRGLKSKGYDQGPIMAGDVPRPERTSTRSITFTSWSAKR